MIFSGSPMLLDLTTLAIELVGDITEEDDKDGQENDPEEAHQPRHNLVVIELDHMRDRRRYIDTLRYILDLKTTFVIL